MVDNNQWSDDEDIKELTDDEKEKREEFCKGLEKELETLNVAIITGNDVKIQRPSIGKGAFGKVYKGLYLDKPVAVKKMILKEEIYEDSDATKKTMLDITNEIKTVKYVTNSRIPIFYGLWKCDGNFHLIFEFCPGRNLKEAYKNLSDIHKLRVILQIAEALETIHEKKLMHRDIKPSNIMIDENLDIKLIDFGVSRIASKTVTFTKDVSGTTRYMAPELYDIPEEDVENISDKPIKITTKIDIWSTGCMISEMFTGILPWMNVAKSELTVSRKLIAKEPFPIPKELTNPDFIELVQKCTKYDVEERLSAKQLADLIREKIPKYE